MTPPPAPLSSRGRPSRLQECQQPLGPPRGPYREGRAAAPHRTLPRTVRPGLKGRLLHAPHSKSAGVRRTRGRFWLGDAKDHMIEPGDLTTKQARAFIRSGLGPR